MKKTLLILIFATSLTLATDTFLHQFFNNKVCDQILENNGYFKTCYDYKVKGAKYVAYTIKGDLVNKNNIKERPRFYLDKNIPNQYRSEYSDYTNNRYKMDRGHMAEDASFDYSQRSLNAIYVMSNIIPQYFTVNRDKKAWAGLERFGRVMATKMGKVNVLNGVIYSNNPKRIGHNQIAIPTAFWKIYYNKEQNFQRCFYFENKPIVDSNKNVSDYEIACKRLMK
ncbi:DNA/RNA non-specific endonuclease [Sulfurimonas sp.]|uniref:DNA/RNA non-specific endonuclease n=1 Tax=Sulfurimonas sp. TaxID=2022749 RepID=UPI0025E5693A|nr:DNA/RNA non-specific endonuclease [Sulfurimonas sp.]MBW6487524.1 DNA/RNA non-specific endonuclease [Sulfurimonas sp.]